MVTDATRRQRNHEPARGTPTRRATPLETRPPYTAPCTRTLTCGRATGAQTPRAAVDERVPHSRLVAGAQGGAGCDCRGCTGIPTKSVANCPLAMYCSRSTPTAQNTFTRQRNPTPRLNTHMSTGRPRTAKVAASGPRLHTVPQSRPRGPQASPPMLQTI